jgi:2',3'-cyclic-nucleotide 2'-phosphodiesterase (5'-nucleotidase family)
MKIIVIADPHGAEKPMARLCSALRKEISQNPDETYVFVHAGDYVGANKILSSFSFGDFDAEVTAEITKQFHPDRCFMVIGNHDFFYGEQQLIKFIQTTGLKTLVTNAEFGDDSALADHTQDHHVLELDDEKIGIMGVLTAETFRTQHQTLKSIQDQKTTIATLKSRADTLKSQGIDKFIIVSHLGLEADQLLAKQLLALGFGNIIICGGHSHITTQKPIVFSQNGKTITVVNAGAHAQEFLTLDVDIETFQLKQQLTKTITAIEDQQIKYIQTQHESLFAASKGLNLGKTLFYAEGIYSGLELTEQEQKTATSHLRIDDSAITRLTADSVAAYTKADFALFPAAGIRSNLTQGPITYRHLYETYLTSNRIHKITVTGEDVVKALAWGIRVGHKHWIARGTLFHPSKDLTYKYDVTGNPEDVIQEVKLCRKPIDLDKTYTVAVTDWMLSSANNFFPNAKTVKVYPDTQICDMVSTYLQKQKAPLTIAENLGQRITAIPNFRAQKIMREELEAKGVTRGDAAVPQETPVKMPISSLLIRERQIQRFRKCATQSNIMALTQTEIWGKKRRCIAPGECHPPQSKRSGYGF